MQILLKILCQHHLSTKNGQKKARTVRSGPGWEVPI
jgi:hypothetical protein